MEFVGIESVVFGTSDLRAAGKFFADWGLETVKNGRTEKIFATEIGSRVVVRAENSRGLAPPLSPAGGFREVIWGVKGKRDLARVAKELGSDRELRVDRDGTIHTHDPNGIGIGFRVWPHKKQLSVKAARFNTGAERTRIDTPAPLYDEGARPLGIGHVVFLAADLEAGERFYRERLGFRLSDRYSGGRAVFLRCSAENEHHNLFFLNTNGAKTEFQHVAFQVRDIHEVFGGGVRMRELGYKTEVGPGRHRCPRPISGISRARSAGRSSTTPIPTTRPRRGSRGRLRESGFPSGMSRTASARPSAGGSKRIGPPAEPGRTQPWRGSVCAGAASAA